MVMGAGSVAFSSIPVIPILSAPTKAPPPEANVPERDLSEPNVTFTGRMFPPRNISLTFERLQ
jgi:hypothetical protein